MRLIPLSIFVAAMVTAGWAEVPSGMAIRNARVVTVSGAVLPKATVLIRDGLIEAVGADLAVPADAWLIEGEGLTVYPGLVDALSTLGQVTPVVGGLLRRVRLREGLRTVRGHLVGRGWRISCGRMIRGWRRRGVWALLRWPRSRRRGSLRGRGR